MVTLLSSHKRKRTLLEAPTGILLFLLQSIADGVAKFMRLFAKTCTKTLSKRLCTLLFENRKYGVVTLLLERCGVVTVGGILCGEEVGDHHGQDSGRQVSNV